jgi:GlpG protein
VLDAYGLRNAPLRQIGTLSGETAARRLVDHLLTLGVTTQVRPESAGWGIWVIDEDRLALARSEFEAFRNNPDDPRFKAAAQSAETIRREAQKLDKQYQKNFRLVKESWDRPNIRKRPLTFALIVVCAAVYLLTNLPGRGHRVENALAFSGLHPVEIEGELHWQRHGVEDILHGEVWRLITPIFLHFSIIHILFNLWALAFLGTLIETRRGTGTLALLVFVSALSSNLGEFLLESNYMGGPALFGGMSGVVYALFGYVWMKGRYEPELGMILHPNSVQIMLIWLVACMIGLLGSIANGAHVVGLLTGIGLGLSRY